MKKRLLNIVGGVVLVAAIVIAAGLYCNISGSAMYFINPALEGNLVLAFVGGMVLMALLFYAFNLFDLDGLISKFTYKEIDHVTK